MPDAQSSFDLSKLIAEEDDPKRRVLLLLVNAFNENLKDNTEAVRNNAQEVRDIGNKLNAHLVNFEERAKKDDEIRNRIKGGWSVVAFVIAIVQVVGLRIWFDTRDDIKGIHDAITAGQAVDIKVDAKVQDHEGRLRILEKRQ